MYDVSIEEFCARFRRQVTDNIAERGQQVQVVHITKDDPPDSKPFMYTIGNYHLGLPELLIVDTDKRIFVDVLNRLGKLQRDRKRAFADEELVSMGGRFPLRIVDAGVVGRTEYASFVGIFYDSQNYEVRQVIIPDTQGRWPDQPGCDLPFARQPILSHIGRVVH